MHHFNHVSITRFNSILLDCGEQVPLKKIKILFKAYAEMMGAGPIHGQERVSRA
jgi:hypothetical protein